MIVALLVVAGILALLFYVMHLVRPKRVRISAKIFKVVEFDVEADAASGGTAQPPSEIGTLEGNPKELPGAGLKALPGNEQKALPHRGT